MWSTSSRILGNLSRSFGNVGDVKDVDESKSVCRWLRKSISKGVLEDFIGWRMDRRLQVDIVIWPAGPQDSLT